MRMTFVLILVGPFNGILKLRVVLPHSLSNCIYFRNKSDLGDP